MLGWMLYLTFSLESAPLLRKTYPQQLQRWCMEQPSVSVENSSLPHNPLPYLTQLTLFPTSKLACRSFDPVHLVLLNRKATSLMVCQRLLMFSSDTMLSEKSLQPPYDGPYPVVKRTDKYFTININGRNDTVSIDRLKPAHIDSDDVYPNTQTPTTPSQTTRSGRRVHFPQYLSCAV